MLVTFDLNQEKLVTAASIQQAINTMSFVRSTAQPLTVQTSRNGAVVDLGAPTIYFVLKTSGKYEENPPLLLTSAFTKSGTGSASQWDAVLNFITTPLDTAFAHDDDDSNDVASVTCMGELVIDDGTRKYRSQELEITIRNNVWQGDDVEPAAEPDGSSYLLAGGNAHIRPELAITNQAELTALTTNGLARPCLIATLIADNVRIWLLRDEVGTETTDYSAGIVKPTDYDGVDNAAILEAYM